MFLTEDEVRTAYSQRLHLACEVATHLLTHPWVSGVELFGSLALSLRGDRRLFIDHWPDIDLVIESEMGWAISSLELEDAIYPNGRAWRFRTSDNALTGRHPSPLRRYDRQHRPDLWATKDGVDQPVLDVRIWPKGWRDRRREILAAMNEHFDPRDPRETKLIADNYQFVETVAAQALPFLPEHGYFRH